MDLKELTKEELLDFIESTEYSTGKYGLIWDREKEPEEIVYNCEKYIPVVELKNEKTLIDENSITENILIEGENFHSLSVLNYTHNESIDVIYIDPPYNTGNKDFMYNDKFVDAEDGYRHSKWLNFMSKRLKIARNLLKDDGMIFVSIDDNEYAQLKLLMDKIYGENNLLSIHHIQVRYGNKSLNEKKDFQEVLEYVLIYAKNKFLFKANKPSDEYDISKFMYKITELAEGEKVVLGNKNVTIFKPHEYEITKDLSLKGLKATWASGSVLKGNTSGKFFDVHISPRKEIDGVGVLYKVEGIGEDGIGYRYFTGPKKETATKGIFYSGIPLTRLEEMKKGTAVKERPIVNFYDFSPDFGNIRQEGGIGFNSGKKPIKMLKQFISYHPNKNAVVLDFFAGSGSIGHAVLELNAEDNGNRQFILCTNNENNICEEITYPRLKNVIEGYGNKEALGGNLKYLKTEFVGYVGSRDQLYYDLTEKCVPMLCLKEGTFEKLEVNDEYVIYTNKEKNKYTCVYFDIFGTKYEEFKEKLTEIEEHKSLYIFTLGNEISEEELKKVENYTIEPIPHKILEFYKKIVRMSKEE